MNGKEQNFDELKRLLKLKQHEVPPPGYFNNFSDQIIARIESGEALKLHSRGSRIRNEAPWLLRVISFFENSPALIGGFATSLCLMLVMGVVLAERTDTIPESIFTTRDGGSGQLSSSEMASTANVLAPAGPQAGIAVSTNPITSLQPVATLFGQPGVASPFSTAGFSASGN